MNLFRAAKGDDSLILFISAPSMQSAIDIANKHILDNEYDGDQEEYDQYNEFVFTEEYVELLPMESAKVLTYIKPYEY